MPTDRKPQHGPVITCEIEGVKYEERLCVRIPLMITSANQSAPSIDS